MISHVCRVPCARAVTCPAPCSFCMKQCRTAPARSLGGVTLIPGRAVPICPSRLRLYIPRSPVPPHVFSVERACHQPTPILVIDIIMPTTITLLPCWHMTAQMVGSQHYHHDTLQRQACADTYDNILTVTPGQHVSTPGRILAYNSE